MCTSLPVPTVCEATDDEDDDDTGGGGGGGSKYYRNALMPRCTQMWTTYVWRCVTIDC